MRLLLNIMTIRTVRVRPHLTQGQPMFSNELVIPGTRHHKLLSQLMGPRMIITVEVLIYQMTGTSLLFPVCTMMTARPMRVLFMFGPEQVIIHGCNNKNSPKVLLPGNRVHILEVIIKDVPYLLMEALF